MKKMRISEALKSENIGQVVLLQGWVRTRRGAKAGLSFLNINDGSCFANIQIVATDALENYAEVEKLTTGCSVQVQAKLIASPAKGQDVEVEPLKIDILGLVEDPETYPMQPKRHSMEHLREHAHLRVRTNLIGAVTRVRHSLSQAVHRFFHERGFYWIHTPIITASDCEGAGEMFRVSTLDFANVPKTDEREVDFTKDFFGKEAHLTVSGQLNVETYCMAMSQVYTFGPTFRAEKSNTRRHLAEFWMIEPEIAFADLNDDVQLAEDFLKYLTKTVLEERADDMAFFNKFVSKGIIGRLEKLVETTFATIEYTDAIKELEKAKTKFDFPVKWGIDLQSEHERYLTDTVFEGPCAVVNYPKDIKAFYMRINDDEKTVAAMDVLAPGIGEIIGGSQREERLDVFDRRLEEMNLIKEDYEWYRDLRKYGTVPHAGFGLGFERMVQYVTGVENIREVIPFPRSPRSADF